MWERIVPIVREQDAETSTYEERVGGKERILRRARLGDKCVAEEIEALSWKVFRIEEEVKRTGVLV